MLDQRALLLTDVVDSTRLSVRIGDAEMARLWAAHDRAARDLLPRWHGREIDKTDGMLLLFDAAADAVGYAVAYQEALNQLAPPLKARAGLHVGPVTLRQNSPADVALGAKLLEVEGVAKATTARVMSVAQGGQILLSAPARQSLSLEGLRLQSHGHWRLKGLDEPLELFEVGHANAPFTPPPEGDKAYRVVRQGDLWLPVHDIRHSLPAERDAFVGRHGPLHELARRFDAGARLVSVLGMGGTGKTRLVTRFGWTWLGDFPGGIWFCDLSQARDLVGVASATAQGLDVPLGGDAPISQLGLAIAGRGRCLIILDNFEQVTRLAQETLGVWLDTSTDAQFLVTSREVLGLPGEQIVALAPLPVGEATELFMCRAAAATSDLQLSADDQAAVAPLVKLLDGLPLAIELAAARIRVMPTHTLLARMNERFRLLASLGGRQDRQATLRATFDWSWELLAAAEKGALAQLSVFEGGFTLEAVEAVLDVSACDPSAWTVDVLHSLVDKSFVRAVGEGRFDLLSSIQAYAAEHLLLEGRYPGSGPSAVLAAQHRHGIWFGALGVKRAVEGNCADLANLVIACRRAIAQADAPLAVAVLRGAWAAVSWHGPFSAGAELADDVCQMTGLEGTTAALAHVVRGSALNALGRPAEARRHYELALGLARAGGDRRCVAEVTASLAHLDGNEGHCDDARVRYLDALALARQLGDPDTECAALNGLANLDFDLGHFDLARTNYEKALTRARESGDRGWQCALLSNLGMLHANIGAIDDAQPCITQSLGLARLIGDRQRESATLCNLGMLHLVQRRPDEAIEACEQALRVARELGHRRVEGIVQCNLGLAHEEGGRSHEALRHFDAALRVMRELGDPLYEGQFLGYQGRSLARLGDIERARECIAAGLALLRDAADPLSLGVLLCDRAECEWRAGDGSTAHQILDEARALAASAGAGPQSELRQALARVERHFAEAEDGPSVTAV